MGSICNYRPFSQWKIEKTIGDKYRVIIGQIDDYPYPSDITTMISKEIFEKLQSKEYKIRRNKIPGTCFYCSKLDIVDNNDNVICSIE
jgi:hypothetical protein